MLVFKLKLFSIIIEKGKASILFNSCSSERSCPFIESNRASNSFSWSLYDICCKLPQPIGGIRSFSLCLSLYFPSLYNRIRIAATFAERLYEHSAMREQSSKTAIVRLYILCSITTMPSHRANGECGRHASCFIYIYHTHKDNTVILPERSQVDSTDYGPQSNIVRSTLSREIFARVQASLDSPFGSYFGANIIDAARAHSCKFDSWPSDGATVARARAARATLCHVVRSSRGILRHLFRSLRAFQRTIVGNLFVWLLERQCYHDIRFYFRETYSVTSIVRLP